MPSTFGDMAYPQDQAKAHAEVARTLIMNKLMTKEDFRVGIDELRRDLEAKIENLSLRLSVRMGIMPAAGLTRLGAVLKPH